LIRVGNVHHRRRLPYGKGGEFPRRITPRRAPHYEELDLRHEFAHLFSGKATKTAANAIFDYSMQGSEGREGRGRRKFSWSD